MGVPLTENLILYGMTERLLAILQSAGACSKNDRVDSRPTGYQQGGDIHHVLMASGVVAGNHSSRTVIIAGLLETE